MLKIYDQNHNAIGHIKKYKDLCIESDVKTGDKTMSFTYLARHHEIRNEYYIDDGTDEYVVKEVPSNSDGFPQIVAVLNLEDLEAKPWGSFSVENSTIDDAARLALAGTGWTVGECTVTKKRNAGMLQVTSKDIIDKLCTAFMCEKVYNSKSKTVSFYERVGEDKGVYFLRGLNLRKLNKKSDSYDYYTRIIPIGANELTIESVNDGKNYLENYQYSNKVKTYIWKDESYTDPQALMEDAELKLEDLSKPAVSYSADVLDLAKQQEKYSILSYGLGDTVTLIDAGTGIREKQRIVKLKRYPQDHSKDSCEIANTILTFEEMQQMYQEAAEIINAVVAGDGRYTGTINVSDILNFEQGLSGSSTVSGLQGSIDSLNGQLASLSLAVSSIETNYLKADQADLKYATIKQLNAINITVGSIQGDYADFKSLVTDELAAHSGKIDNLETTKLSASQADLKYAQIDLANIEQGCITTAMLGTGIVGTAQIADGSITDAKIVELTANKITAGTLSVERLIIRGSENSLVYALNNITGALQAQNVDTLNGEILSDRTITADKIVAKAITANEIAAKSITANEIASNTITGNEIKANTITASNIAAKSLTADVIDVDNLFAQDITATGTIEGVTLIGATGSFSGSVITSDISANGGNIGGWNVDENALYLEEAFIGGADTRTVVLQNSRKNFLKKAKVETTNGVMVWEKDAIVLESDTGGSGTLKITLPIEPGYYTVKIKSGYTESGKNDDSLNMYITYYTDDSEEPWETYFDNVLTAGNIRVDYDFEVPQNAQNVTLYLNYTMPGMEANVPYRFKIEIARDGSYVNPGTVEGVPPEAVFAIKKTSGGSSSILFSISEEGVLHSETEGYIAQFSAANVSATTANFSGTVSAGGASVTGTLTAGAVTSSGVISAVSGTISGALTVSGTITAAAVKVTGVLTGSTVTMSGALTAASVKSSGEIVSTSANAFRAALGNYGFIIRNDGGAFYLMSTAAGDPYGTWSNYITIAAGTCDTTFPRDVTVRGRLISTENHAASWIGSLNGSSSVLYLSNSGVSTGFSAMTTIKTTNGAWATGAYNHDNAFYILYGTNSRISSGENGYDTGFVFSDNGNLTLKGTITSGGYGVLRAASANGYYGFVLPNGSVSDWVRTTQSGIIPYQSGGYGSIGTSSWPFNQLWAKEIYCTNFAGTTNQRPCCSYNTNGRRVAFVASRGSGNTYKVNFNGQYSDNASSTAYKSLGVTVSSSDIRLKKNIRDTEIKALPVINKIRMRQFDWIETGSHQELGFVADELECINPNFASGGGYDEDGSMDVKIVNEFYLLGYLTKAVQEIGREMLTITAVSPIMTRIHDHESRIQSVEKKEQEITSREEAIQLQLSQAFAKIAELENKINTIQATA